MPSQRISRRLRPAVGALGVTISALAAATALAGPAAAAAPAATPAPLSESSGPLLDIDVGAVSSVIDDLQQES